MEREMMESECFLGLSVF